MALSVVMFSACAPSCSLLSSSNNEQSDNSGNGGQNQNSDTGSGNNQNNDDNSNSNNDTTTNPDYSQYSPILQTVLTDPYYDDKDNTFAYEGIPLKSFEREGCNIELIETKLDPRDATTNVYSLNDTPNSLNTYTRFTIDQEVYSLITSYNLTEKEMNEFKMLVNGKYLQSYLWIHELDKQRTPSYISLVKYDLDVYTQFNLRYSSQSGYNIQFHLTDIEKFTTTEGTYWKFVAAILGNNKIYYKELGAPYSTPVSYENNKLTIKSADYLLDVTSDEVAKRVDKYTSYSRTNSYNDFIEKN